MRSQGVCSGSSGTSEVGSSGKASCLSVPPAPALVERVFDGLVMLGLMALAIAAPSFPVDASLGGRSVTAIAISAAALFGGVLIVAGVTLVRVDELLLPDPRPATADEPAALRAQDRPAVTCP